VLNLGLSSGGPRTTILPTLKHQPKSQSAQLAEYLGRLIKEGALEGLLPSVRLLADRNGVSTLTVVKALRLLAAGGLIESRGPKRRVRVSWVRQHASAVMLVVLLTPTRRLHASIVASLRLLEEKCRQDGLVYKELVVAEMSAEERLRKIRHELPEKLPNRVICIHPDQELCDVLVGTELSVAVLPLLPVKAPGKTIFNVPQVSVLVHAVRRALAFGHRQIVILDNFMSPTSRSQLVAQASFLGARVTFLRVGNLGDDNWIHDKKAIERIYARILGGDATCVIFPQWPDFMACADALSRSGLALPGRLSVVVAYLNGGVETYQGLPVAGFEIPEDLAFRMFAAWLAEGRCDPESFGEAVAATWRAGQTLRPPPPGHAC